MKIGKEKILQLVLDKVSNPNFGRDVSATAYEYILHAVVGAYKANNNEASRWNAAMDMLMALPNSPIVTNNSRGMRDQCANLIKDMFGNINRGPKGKFPSDPLLQRADAEDLLYYVSWMARFKSENARTLASII